MKPGMLALISLCILWSCGTGDRQIETPQGTRTADQVGPWEILGVISKATSTLKQSNAHTAFTEDIKINVPPGTQIIIPAMRGYSFGYGSTTPDDLSTDPNQKATWHTEDHNLGHAEINIYVKDIDAVDNSVTPATQTATITVTALVSDENGDDDRWAYTNYNLLCLGRKLEARGAPLEPEMRNNQ